MKLIHAVSGAAVAAALLIGFGATTPVVQAAGCVVSNVKDLKDRCPPGLAYAPVAVPAHAPVIHVTPVSYTTHHQAVGCIKTNVVNLKGACPFH